MKKYILVLLLFVISIKSYSQRMIYKQKGMELNMGAMDTKDIMRNFYINLTLTSYARHGNYWMWSAEYQKRTTDYKEWSVPVETYLTDIGYSMRLLADTKKFITVNVGVTGAAGYEVANKGDSLLLDGAILLDKNQFVYGTGGRLSIETYLNDRIVLLLQGRVKVLWGTDFDRVRPSCGIGFRFNF
ncbi:conjugal transfer protein TraO [Elizabethkingia ursingii]|uniref:conjugal transfer protein TraO n=1 Tax=Elizabethkingia ursingii TaxID=1756150 RepID=UPI0020120F85|nr:conjugal transfer protein TraO [Elizabethkingia ursingii]MCL1666552.1 conjugal transfer protein TraO [Elizabethkingia ursingii]